MPLRDEQRQYSGVTHGGVLAALADTIAGFAAYTMTPLDKDVLTAELKISFCGQPGAMSSLPEALSSNPDDGCISANAKSIVTTNW